jgi:N-carbamoyl-L-amino-acid hydrolase
MDRRTFTHAMTAASVGVALRRPRIQDDDWKGWRVNGNRVNRFLADLSQHGRTPAGGVSRTGFSDADVAGRRFTMGIMREAGLEVQIDATGNILGRRNGTVDGARPILFGSHIDSVTNGGNYDGDVGSMAAIEVAHTLAEKQCRNHHPLVVTIWSDEERGSFGAKGFVGNLSQDELRRPRADGVSLADLLPTIGGAPAQIAATAAGPGSIEAYLELHVEQGGFLDSAGIPIGVVEGIVGIHHYYVTITGVPNHAGTTPMDQRNNSLLAASEFVMAVDEIVRSEPGHQVGTVGRLEVSPNAPNVVPGEVTLTVELRDLSTQKIEALWQRIESTGREIAPRYGTTFAFEPGVMSEPALSDLEIRRVIEEAVADLGLVGQRMPSGAGHDAQELARIGPMGMIFVPSVDGVSHSPREFTRPEDIENGANVLLQTVLRLDQR